jgi:hypothetical protein
MNSLVELLSNPLFWKLLLSYWAFCSAVGALPDLKSTSPGWYSFLYRFMHSFAGNLKSAAVRFNVPSDNQP